MLSPKTKRNISRIIPFGLIWLIFSLIYIILEKGLLGDLTYYPSTETPYDFTNNFIIIPVSALFSGLLVGTIEILYINNIFIQKSLSKKIVYKTIIYVIIMISFLIITDIIGHSIRLQTNMLDKQVWDNLWIFFSNFTFWSTELYIAGIIGVTLFYSEVSENLGQGVLKNFFTGKYHTPTEEERIFMFLDMKSSTTIAEKLGHVQYFEMLKDYYSDLSASIIQYSGEIYQYVGDEVIVSWKLRSGLQNNNCLKCFFAMKEAIKNQTGKYQDKFSIVPVFKAGLHLGKVTTGGLHLGKVTTGEIGVLKKEIIFTGDVLNTTARIQGLCNNYKVDILISGHVRIV